MKKKFMQDMSWDEFEDALKRCDRTVIIPVGSTEGHGHYPLWADCYGAIGPMNRVAELVDDVIFTPLIPIGYSQYHAKFPGTLSLGFDTLTKVYEEICECLIRAGTEKIVWLVGHEGDQGPLNIASRNLKEKYGTLFVAVAWVHILADTGEYDPKIRQLIEGHAGIREGSLILACVSEELRKDILARGKPYVSQGKKINAWGTDNLIDPKWVCGSNEIVAKLKTSLDGDVMLPVHFPSGEFHEFTPYGIITQDPKKHNVEYGRAIIEKTAQHLIKILEEIKKIKVPLEGKPARL